MPDSHDLAVIGGGLVGSAIAWGAARLGADVALLDEGDVAFRAARGNFGLVWVQSKGDGLPPYANWTRRSAALWPDLAAELSSMTGTDVALRQPGGLHFCLSEQEVEQRAAMISRMHNATGDIGTRLLDRGDVRAMVPGLGPQVQGAAYCPKDGHANPLLLLRALQAGFRRHRGRYLPGARIERITPRGADFAIELGTTHIVVRRIVIAAGLGSATLAPLVGLSMPVRPVRGQIMVTERLRPLLDWPTAQIRQTVEGSIMIGDSHEDVGFDEGTSATEMQRIAARALATFPALGQAQIVRHWGALRVMTQDGAPIYEQSGQYPGAFAATCHSGVTLAGSHALALAPAILDGVLPDELRAFTSERFHVPTV